MPRSVQPLEPLPGFAVLKEYKLNEKIAGRFLVPTDAQNAPSIGEVIAVGADTLERGELVSRMLKRDNIQNLDASTELCEVGDIVAYQNYGAQELTLENVKYFIVPFDKLLTKLNIKESK